MKGDECFNGRVYGRYGSYVGPTVTDPKTGEVYQDDRHRPYPEFMDKISITDFVSGCEELAREKEFDGLENNEFETDETSVKKISLDKRIAELNKDKEIPKKQRSMNHEMER